MSYTGSNPRFKSVISKGDTLANLTGLPRVSGKLVWATDQLKFYFDNGTSLFPLDTTNPIIPRTIVVGSSAQVASGEADYSSLVVAQVNAVDGDMLYIKSGLYIGNFTMNKNLFLKGEGNGTILQGNMNFDSGRNGAGASNLKFDGAVSLITGSTNCMIDSCWLSALGSIVDSGTNNVYVLWQEV